jgi:hypothetical protein
MHRAPPREFARPDLGRDEGKREAVRERFRPRVRKWLVGKGFASNSGATRTGPEGRIRHDIPYLHEMP